MYSFYFLIYLHNISFYPDIQQQNVDTFLYFHFDQIYEKLNRIL